MAPKAKGGKALQTLAALNAVQSTYKAACRRHGVTLHKVIQAQIEQALLDGTKITKLSFSGADQGPGALKAALELAAVYPAVKNLTCYGCNMGDEGLLALAQLLKASVDRWWKGSKLKLLELVSDGIGLPLERWPERTLAHMNGALAVQGAGHAQPRLALGEDEMVTPLTHALSQLGLAHAQSSAAAAQGQLDHMRACSGPVTSLMYQAVEDSRVLEEAQRQERVASGALACAPSAGFINTVPRKARDLALATTHQLAGSGGSPEPAGSRSLSPVRTLGRNFTQSDSSRRASLVVRPDSVRSPRTSNVDTDGLDASAEPVQPQQREPLTARSSILQRAASPEPAPSVQSIVKLASGKGSWAGGLVAEFDASPADAAPAVIPAGSFAAGTQGAAFLTQLHLTSARPMTFSLDALQAFALALRAQGHGLQVLVMDHNQLGDVGMQALAAGLARCGSLQQLSLEDCGVGPVGAEALGATLVPHPDPKLQPLTPQLVHLNLSRNPLGGAGVTALSRGLLEASKLKALNLAAVGLTGDDLQPLEVLASTLTVNTAITQVDLDANFIGDQGAAVFVPFLTSAAHLQKFRITARGMTREGGGGQVAEIMRGKFPKKAGGKKGLKKKQK